MRILLYQLVPIAVLLLPLVETVVLTLYWRRSLSSPWVYGIAGTVLAYAVAVAVMFAVETLKPSGGGTLITKEAPVWRDDGRKLPDAKTVQAPSRPTFAPLTPSWFALLGLILMFCGTALWGLRFFFRSQNT